MNVGDVIDAAFFCDEVGPVSERVSDLVRAEARAAESEGIDEAVLQAKSEQWRGERELITAEETEAWLILRGLTLDDFSNHFFRHAALEKEALQSKSSEVEAPETDLDLRELLRIELLLSGEFDALALRHSWRFAARQAATTEPPLHLVEAERTRFQQRAGFPAWLGTRAHDRLWLEEMAALEAGYRSQAESLLSAEARARMLTTQHLPLTRVQLELLEVESLDAAREAFLCVREDGIPLAEIAADGRYSLRHLDAFYEDLPEDLQRSVLCATAGEVLEPIPHADGYQLWRLRQKQEPDLADSAVRERVDQRIQERHFSELATTCIRWMMPCGTPYVAAI